LTALLRTFVEICLFRLPPQVLPDSRFLLGLTVIVYAALGVLQMLVDGMRWLPTLVIGILDPLLLAEFIWLALYFRNRKGRFRQTATAAFGTGVVLTLVAIPVLATAGALGAGPFTGLLVWVIFFWGIAVLAHILRHALEIRGLASGLLAFAYTLATLILYSGLFPPAGS
jgi:hypothetical protein